jgi:hypothetical protein
MSCSNIKKRKITSGINYEHKLLQSFHELQKKSKRDCGRVIAGIQSRLASNVEAIMIRTLEEEDISHREKARKLRREMRREFGTNDMSTRNEIIADKDNLSFCEDIPTANKLITNLIQLNNVLRKMGHPRSDEHMRALLFNKLHGPLFQRVLSNLNTGRDGITFSIACAQLQQEFSSHLAKEYHRRKYTHLSSSGAAGVQSSENCLKRSISSQQPNYSFPSEFNMTSGPNLVYQRSSLSSSNNNSINQCYLDFKDNQ